MLDDVEHRDYVEDFAGEWVVEHASLLDVDLMGDETFTGNSCGVVADIAPGQVVAAFFGRNLQELAVSAADVE